MLQAAAPDGEPLRVPPSGLEVSSGTAGRRRVPSTRRAKVGGLASPSGRRAGPLRPRGAPRDRFAHADPTALVETERAALG